MTSLPWTPSRVGGGQAGLEQPVVEARGRARRRAGSGWRGPARGPSCRRGRARPGSPPPRRAARPASRRRARSRRGRSPGTGRCGSRGRRRRGSRAAPGSRRRRGSTSRRRRRPGRRCAASVVRSADSSKVSWAPRCTPPSPPVAKTVTPARAARWAVEATVVDPTPPRAATDASSRTLTFMASSSFASRSRAASSSPTRAWPSMTATVAGTAPPSRTACSNSRASRALSGRGQAVADDGALQRDHRTALGQRVAHLLVHQHGLSPSWIVSCSPAGRTRVGPARVPHPAGHRAPASRRRT